MRLGFVVQRYGVEVPGGAERACREFATRLAARGHDVEVMTTCALRYSDWANHYPEGESVVDGVRVQRLAVPRPRDQRLFGALDSRLAGPGHTPAWLEAEWIRMQGPWVPELPERVAGLSATRDVTVFFTYLYATTWAGLPAARGRTVLHPTAHDEAPLYRHAFDAVFARPDALAFLTEEEEALVRRRFRCTQPSAVVGVGTELDGGDRAARDAGLTAFRRASGLGERPYLVYVGRFDVGKATEELVRYFVAYKERNPGPLALVIVGEAVEEPPAHPDIVVTGFIDEATKQSVTSGALALVQPSYFESFSIVLIEAWALGVPAIVQGRCDVLAGQVRRSRGGVPYEGFAEFEAALDMLAGDPALRLRLGQAGRAYVTANYGWDSVLERYEAFLADVARVA